MPAVGALTCQMVKVANFHNLEDGKLAGQPANLLGSSDEPVLVDNGSGCNS